MSMQEADSEEQAAATAPARVEHVVEPTVELNPTEARVLGALIEKSFLTPDVYPMTTNGLVTACNQKTSRDPVVAFTANEVDGTLLELRQRKLVRRVHTQGARSTKHRHALDEVLPLSEEQIVVLSVLLLRGDQSAGELRTRTERHAVFDEPHALQDCLDSLAQREPPLVTELARQSGHKDTRWRHLLGDGSDASDVDSQSPETPSADTSVAAVQAAPIRTSVPGATSGTAGTAATSAAPTTKSPPNFAARVEILEATVAELQAQLQALAASLGEELA